jgi:predicted AAA+ superfamily ATPase
MVYILIMDRLQKTYIFDEKVHAGKMIFLSGPRQVGKTTFARNYLKQAADNVLYWNWDDPLVRREYQKNPRFIEPLIAASRNACPIVVFDEIHKQKNWKNILKGFYDVFKGRAIFFVTGSARLDFFRSSGDSLVGRYSSYRLLPLGLPEAAGDLSIPRADTPAIFTPAKDKVFLKTLMLFDEARGKKAFSRLLTFGGFPEPFIKADAGFSLRWRKDYASLLTREDIRDLTRIQDIRGVEHLLLLLPERIGAPLSVNSLREDLDVHHKTVTQWLDAFKKIYLVFSIKPWTEHVARAIKKEEKYYFYDWTFVESEACRFENMLAVMLLRMICRFNELGLGDFDLRYIRNKSKEEVDFLVVKDRKPFALFEAKTKETDIPSHAMKFSCALKVPYYQVLSQGAEVQVMGEGRYVIPAWRLFMLTA